MAAWELNNGQIRKWHPPMEDLFMYLFNILKTYSPVNGTGSPRGFSYGLINAEEEVLVN